MTFVFVLRSLKKAPFFSFLQESCKNLDNWNNFQNRSNGGMYDEL